MINRYIISHLTWQTLVLQVVDLHVVGPPVEGRQRPPVLSTQLALCRVVVVEGGATREAAFLETQFFAVSSALHKGHRPVVQLGLQFVA